MPPIILQGNRLCQEEKTSKRRKGASTPPPHLLATGHPRGAVHPRHLSFAPKSDRLLGAARERNAERARRDVVQERFGRLSPREREVCDGVAGGLLNKQIAHAMGISEKTVKVHRGRVMEKLEVTSVADLVRLTTKAGEGPGAGSVSSVSPTQGRGA